MDKGYGIKGYISINNEQIILKLVRNGVFVVVVVVARIRSNFYGISFMLLYLKTHCNLG